MLISVVVEGFSRVSFLLMSIKADLQKISRTIKSVSRCDVGADRTRIEVSEVSEITCFSNYPGVTSHKDCLNTKAHAAAENVQDIPEQAKILTK